MSSCLTWARVNAVPLALLQAAKESAGFAVIKDKTTSIAMPHRVSGACLLFITITEYVHMHHGGFNHATKRCHGSMARFRYATGKVILSPCSISDERAQ